MGVVLTALLVSTSWPAEEPTTGFVAAMNAGKAHLENREADQALASYERAVALKPQSLAARINVALAHLLVRQKDQPRKHLSEALKHLAEAQKLDPDCVAAHYLSGLAHVHLNEYEPAVKELEASARLDPVTAAIRYQLANAYKQLGQHDKAQEQLRKTIELDPLHASAHYQLAMYARKERRQSEARSHIKEFTRLRKLLGEAARDPNMLERCVHTKPVDPESPAEPPPAGVEVRFVDVTDRWCEGLKLPSEPGCAAGVLDADGDGKWDVLLADASGSVRLWKGQDGGFSEAELLSLKPRAWSRCLIGDYDNNGKADALLVAASGCALLRCKSEPAFEDATETSGLAGAAGVDAAWVDFDHDGDLDVLVAGGAERPASLWLNRGNGTFTENNAQARVPRDVLGVVGVAAGDIHADDALDLVLASASGPSTLLINTREVIPADGRAARALAVGGQYRYG
jgi:Flp pilus assembly protein TadD